MGSVTGSSVMTGYPFWKMTGSGNDFILMDHREIPWEDCRAKLPEITRALCRRRMSVGADGLIVIVPPENPENTFAWRFHNSDGSVAEMCGNGARCAARFAYLKGIAKSEELRFETLAGVIHARIQGDRVLIGMGDAWDIRKDITVQVGGKSFVMTHVNTGVPHVVCFVDDADSVDLESLGRSLRYHDMFQPAGANVNFVHMMDGGKNPHADVRTGRGRRNACLRDRGRRFRRRSPHQRPHNPAGRRRDKQRAGVDHQLRKELGRLRPDRDGRRCKPGLRRGPYARSL